MPTVAGIDCSTQSTKVVVCDADSGAVLASGTASHPDATEVDPAIWWAALKQAAAGPDGGLLQGVDAVAVGGQQHGMVLLDGEGHVVRPALLWNDTRSAADAADLVAEQGGGGIWAEAVGSVPVASFTVTKLRWTARNEPESAARAEAVLLPHDWLTWLLCGGRSSTDGDPSVAMTTDRGDASGTGYWSPAAQAYRTDLLVAAFGRELRVPDVLGPSGKAGHTPAGALVAAGTGDNMATALGLGLEAGDLVISLGTSGTAFAVTDEPAADASGAVAGFADATGRFLPLVCTLNAARVLDATARLLGTDHDGLSRLALQAPAGADGLTLLPYLDGERTPDLPQARGSLHGMRRDNLTPAHLARAAVEGMLCGLADGVDALRAQGLTPRRALLVGGAARSAAVQQVAAEVLGVPVTVPAPAEYVALGAARQAAWALSGAPAPPEWPVALSPSTEPGTGDGAAVRAAYSAAREAMYG